MEGTWETKDENLISDIRAFNGIYEEMMRRMRRHIDDGRLLSGFNPETMSFVYLQPAILIYDPVRHGPNGEGVPTWVIKRVNFRPIKVHMHGFDKDVSRIPAIDTWQRKQFHELGYLVLLLPTIDLQKLPQGRRQLDIAEDRVRVAFETWTFALMPEIHRLFYATKEGGGATAADAHDTPGGYLVLAAPEIMAAAERSAVSRKVEPRPIAADIVHTYLEAVQNEGRKHRIAFHGDTDPSPLHGDALRARIKRSGTRNKSSGKGRDDELLAIYVEILHILAKARRTVTEVMSARVVQMKNYQKGMDTTEEPGTHNILSNRDQFPKRTLNAANKVLNAQMPKEYVQPPATSNKDNLSVSELGVIAFLCDVDPYAFCAQHGLYFPEVWVARGQGALSFKRRKIIKFERDLAEVILSGELSAQNSPDSVEHELIAARMMKDIEFLEALFDL